MAGAPNIFDKAVLRQRRNRAAAHAAAHDFLLQRVAEDMAERLSIIRRTFAVGVNFGAYHGVVSRALCELPSIGCLIDTGSASALLALCDPPRVLMGDDHIAFAPASLDLAVSALSLHLIDDLPGTLLQIRQALKPDGLLLVTLLGGATLQELREAWLVAEDEMTGGASPRVAPFADVRDLGGLLQRAGFALPVADSDTITARYATPLDLMRDIKGMGASNMLVARRRRPVTLGLLKRACEVYAERFSDRDGRVRATFELITLTAWVPHESQQKPLQPGSATARLADALGVPERPAGDKAGR